MGEAWEAASCEAGAVLAGQLARAGERERVRVGPTWPPTNGSHATRASPMQTNNKKTSNNYSVALVRLTTELRWQNGYMNYSVIQQQYTSANPKQSLFLKK